ncbi:MAG: hypothetical protein JSU96_13235 [Acidobacteriota bacterium]|nr:MAG: hypothetical protein JSU96_13235 [Acidobacteriota bacterium]
MRTNVKATLTVFLVFFLGMAVGGFATYLISPPPLEAESDSRAGSRREGRRFDPTEMYEVLGLDSEQKAKIQQIFEDSRKEFRAASKESRQKLDAIRERTRAQIKEVLRPDQQEKFDEFIAREKERHRRNRERSEPEEKK